MLEGILSTQAERLYITLLKDGTSTAHNLHEMVEYDEAVQELLMKNFARATSDGKRLIPVAPRLAIQAAVLAVESHMLDEHEVCARAIAVMPSLEAAYMPSPTEPESGRIVRSVPVEEARNISMDMVAAAHHEVMTFQTGSSLGRMLHDKPGRPQAIAIDRLRHRGVRMRCIFDTDCLASSHGQDAVERFEKDGFEVRAVHNLPGAMMLVDRGTALLSVDSPDSNPALMVSDKTIANQLGSAFEAHWTRGVPLAEDGGPGEQSLSRMQQRQILGMLAAGMKDESIARHLGVSLRTLRRSITTMSESAGVPTRFALAVVATKLGWIGSQSAVGLTARPDIGQREEALTRRKRA